jgi:phosphoglycolate phosphatase
MIKQYIFDLDGTMVDSFPMFAENLRVFSEIKGLPTYDFQQFKNNYAYKYTQDLGWGVSLAEQKTLVDEYFPWCRKAFFEYETLQPNLFDGVKDMLQTLSEERQFFIATSRDQETTEFLLHKHGITDYFTDVVTSDCMYQRGLKDKPAPDMLWHLFNQNNINPQTAIVVGDTVFDIEAAHSVNVKSIAISHGAHDVVTLRTAKPDYLVHNIPELKQLIKFIS